MKTKLLIVAVLSLCLLLGGCDQTRRTPPPNQPETSQPADTGEGQKLPAQATACPVITDEELCQRALYLLDPYVLPVSWWLGGDPLVLDSLYSLKSYPSHYLICLRFSSVEEMRRCTTQIVTQHYAEEYLYPQLKEEAYILGIWGVTEHLLWDSSSPCTIDFSYPVAAEVTQRKGDTARLLVRFENGSESLVEMKLEDGIWKLNSTPYISSPLSSSIEDYQENVSESQISDEGLVQRLLCLYHVQDNPAHWWIDPMAAQLLGIPLYEEHPVIEVDGILYDQASRFHNLDELAQVTKQVFSNSYVEDFLQPWAKENQHFIEQDGKLYACHDGHIGFGYFSPKEAKVLRRDENSATLLMIPGEPLEEDETAEMEMVLENGVWKLKDLYFTRRW